MLDSVDADGYWLPLLLLHDAWDACMLMKVILRRSDDRIG